MPEWCPQISFLFSFFFWDRAGLCSQSSPSVYHIAVRLQLPLFPGRTNKHPPKYTNQKDSLPVCTEEKPKIFLLLFPLCWVFFIFLFLESPLVTLAHIRQFSIHLSPTSASTSVSDGCQHDHGARHQMADLGSVSWVSEGHLLAVWRWVQVCTSLTELPCGERPSHRLLWFTQGKSPRDTLL